jgi:AsmA protein
LDLELDQIDLDGYLSAQRDEASKGDSPKAVTVVLKKEKSNGSTSLKKNAAGELLRRLVLNGTLKIGTLKVTNARIQDLSLKIAGKNGIFRLEPFSLKLYQGTVSATGSLNVKKDLPESMLKVQAKDIHAGPLFNDIADKDILEGKLGVDMALQMKGADAQRFKKSLNGQGNFFIEDGAVKGIDLVAMVRNTDGAYGFLRKAEEKPKTEFNELQVPFTLKNGVFFSDNARMVSTLIRVRSKGKIDLVGETLNFRIEPTFVTTGKEDREKMKQSEVMIPVLVTGKLSGPKFRPDLRGIAEQKLEEKVFESSKFKELFEKEELKPFEKDAKELLKGILGGPSAPKEER